MGYFHTSGPQQKQKQEGEKTKVCHPPLSTFLQGLRHKKKGTGEGIEDLVG